MRKVYSLLAIQLIMTTLIGATLIFTPGVKEMVQVTNGFWAYFVPGLEKNPGFSRFFRVLIF